MNEYLVQIGLGLIILPWTAWVTSSIFNQRQELALAKQTHDDLKGMMKVLTEVFQKK